MEEAGVWGVGITAPSGAAHRSPRAPLDVRVLEVPDERLPAQVETAAYFIVSESLTNAAKDASAAAATVRIGRANGTAVVEVSDDGVGGADPTRSGCPIWVSSPTRLIALPAVARRSIQRS